MTAVFQHLVLGAVQGLTEFLPVSSSGHLILARELFGANTSGGLAADAVLQLGTILAVYVYFRREVLDLILTALSLVTGRKKYTGTGEQRILIGILVGTLPALFLGLLLEKTMETVFRSALVVALMLIAGSILFIIAERVAKARLAAPTVLQSWWIGWFQTLALVPGLSRSGATISGGLLLGLTREAATRFSFLLSLPIITGSGLLKLAEIVRHRPPDIQPLGLALGFLASFVVGYLSIRWLLRYLKTHSLMAFVWYRLALAAAVILIVAR